MTAESAGEGQGSTFSVYPADSRRRDRGPPVPCPSSGAPRARTLDLEGTHVLIVDDEPDARELLRVMLADTGARISEAESAAEALRIYSRGSARHHPG